MARTSDGGCLPLFNRNKPEPEPEPPTPMTEEARKEMLRLYEVVQDKAYPTGLREKEQKLAYSMLMDHLDDIETRTRRWGKYVRRAVELVFFCGLVAALVCFLSVEPTNRKRLLRLRLWQWATMALMITAIFSVVPCATWLLSFPFKIVFRTHKYWVYYLRRMKRSVDYTLWSCLVLAGWYMWFRPRLKHVYGDVSVIVCQQVTRLLIALCIGFFLWIFKTALYLKLEADLHYDQLFDRIKKTIEYLNGLMILQRKERAERSPLLPPLPPAPDFLSYDKEALADSDFWDSGTTYKKPFLVIKYEARGKWRNWCRRFKTANCPPQSGEAPAAESGYHQRTPICCNNWMDVRSKWVNWCPQFKTANNPPAAASGDHPRPQINQDSKNCCNIWMDVRRMKRESVPIWILVRLCKEYLKAVKSIKPPDAEEVINDDEKLLETAKQMFRDITGLEPAKLPDIDQFYQFGEIKKEDLAKAVYELSQKELDYLFRKKLYETDKTGEVKQAEKTNDNQGEEEKKMADDNNKEEVKETHKEGAEIEYKSIGVDEFLQWAVRVHKHCWGLERTLMSSKIAFVKLNRMLGAFLFVVVVIIWLLLSKIVNTGQLALLFAPFLAVSFMFENSSKNLFQGIIFSFAMHPFDVGDRVIIEDIQMRVMKLHILTSVFYKYDTGAEVIFPNSKLAKTKIVNLDITPDQSDMLEFIIDSSTPLENIRDLELTIQRLLDDDIYYSYGTKVVKNSCYNPDNKEELKMSVHFKYLVSYLTADKKAKRKSEILSKIMRFRKEMETEENKEEYPLDYKPYDLELATNKKVMVLLGIQRMKKQILDRVMEEYAHAKIVLTHVEDYKIKMALYVCKISKQDEKKKDDDDDDGSQMSNEEELDSHEKIKAKPKKDNFFHGFESLLSEYGYSNELKVVRDGKIVYPYPSTYADSWRRLSMGLATPRGKDAALSTTTITLDDIEETSKDQDLINLSATLK